MYLQPCASFGGAERQAATTIPRLAAHGFDVVPLVGPNTVICRWLDEQHVKGTLLSHGFPGGWPKARGLERLELPGRYLRCRDRIAEQVESLLASGSIDLVYAAMPFSWVAATAPARRAGVPIVWRSGGTLISPLEKVALWSWAQMNRPDLLVCCGQAVKDVFGPLIPGPAEVVRNGVDLKMFQAHRFDTRHIRPSWAPLVVGFAARLVPQKRPQDFLAMALRLARRHPEVAFLVAGDGSRRQQYEQMARDLGIEQSVRFLGFVSDMRAFYAACDVVVLPSQSEGCPNVVLEAMASERALVVADTPATTEVLTHGREGLVYPCGDIQAFTDAVLHLVELPKMRLEFARAARERVLREFDADAAVTRLARVLRSVAERRGVPVPVPGRLVAVTR